MNRQVLSLLAVPLLLAGCQDNGREPPPAAVLAPHQEQLQASIIKDREQAQKEFMAGKLDAYVTYVHPDLIRMLGGKEAFKARIAPRLPEIIKTIEGTTMGKVSDVLVDSKRLVAIVPMEMRFKFPDGEVIETSYDIACSTDDGLTWTFMSGSRQQEDFYKKEFPVLTKYVRFPKCTTERVR